MIHEARKRRQMARELGDYVPVDDSVQVEKSASRLVRSLHRIKLIYSYPAKYHFFRVLTDHLLVESCNRLLIVLFALTGLFVRLALVLSGFINWVFCHAIRDPFPGHFK